MLEAPAIERALFHDGMREFQVRFDGRCVAEAIETHHKHQEFWDGERALITNAPFFIA